MWAKVSMLATALTAAALLAYGTWLQGTLHERQYAFAHLTDAQKAMTLHSEQAFYISYFFDTIKASTPFSAWAQLVSDTVSEVPATINVLNRFNVYPEFVLGLAHRITSMFVWINGYTYVLSAIWALSGVQLAVLFLLGRLVSGSYLGGAITATAFVFNLNETTRVYTNPLLRESFSLPFLWIQITLLVRVLQAPKRHELDAPPDAEPEPEVDTRGLNKKAAAARRKMAARMRKGPSRWQRFRKTVEPSLRLYPELVISTALFMISWQFTQFVMFLQTAALLATHLLGYISGVVLFDILICTMGGAVVVAFLMFGNLMLLTSLFLCFAGSIVVLQLKGFFLLEITGETPEQERARRPVRGAVSVPTGAFSRFTNAVWGVILAFACTFALKFLMSAVTVADAHVFNLLKAKLTDYEDYDTALYLCGSAYGLLPWAMWNNLGTTFLSHRAIAVGGLILAQMVFEFFSNRRSADPVLVFLFWQTLAFLLLGVTIMRLMLFFTPSFCLLSGVLASPQLYSGLLDTLSCRRSPAQNLAAKRAGEFGSSQQPGSAKPPSGAGKRSAPAPASDAIPLPPTPRQKPAMLFVVLAALVGLGCLYANFYYGSPVLEAKIEGMTATDPAGYDDTVELMDWLNRNTRKDATVVSSLALSSTIKLVTGRRLAIHPHAEDYGMRQRYRLMYTMYGKFSEDAVFASMRALRGDLLVIPFASCDGKCSNRKSLSHLATLGAQTAHRLADNYDQDQGRSRRLDLGQDAWKERHDQFCFLITEEPMKRFRALFQNDKFLVLQVP